MAIAKLTIDLEARLANLQAGLDKAGLLAERQADRMNRAFSGASRALAGAGAALAAAFSVSALSQWVRSTVAGVDALNDLADATGASVANLSALEDVAARTGTSLDTAGDAVVRMNKALADAKPGTDAARAFQALGLSVDELKRQDPVEAFQQLARALQTFENDANKARLVQELFGKSLRQVAPLLKDLAEAGPLKPLISSEQAAEAERFNRQLTEMQKNFTDLSRTLLGPVIKAFNGLFEAMRMSRESGKGFLASALDVERIERAVQSSAGDYSNEGRNYIRRIGDITAAVPKPAGAGRTPRAAAPEPFGPEISPALKSALDRIEQADENKLARLRAELDQLLSLIAGGTAVPDSALAALVDDITRLDPAAQAAARAQAELAITSEQVRAIFDATRTPAEQFVQTLERLNQLRDQLGADTYSRAVEQARDAFLGAQTQIEQTDNVARELGLTFSSAFEDAIIAGEDLRSVLQGLEKDILRIVTRKLVTEPLAEGVTGLLGGLGGGEGIGGFIAKLFAGGFADGGFVSPGRWGIAGERGPEPVFGGRTGLTVQPAGGVSVVNHFHLAGPADMRTQAQIAAATARSVERAARRLN